LGTPKKALEVAQEAVKLIHHYPAADFEPALSALAAWLSPGKSIKSKFTMGNGASELIDLITRQAGPGPFKPGPSVIDKTPVQYMEYQRSASSHGRKILHSDDPEPEAISAIINPCNPTGIFLNLEQLKTHILTKHTKNSFVLVDESMLPWFGANWREQSLTSIPDWLENVFHEKGIAVWVIHSWTKIWCCPGVRLGSVLAPTVAHMTQLKKNQVPWSLNTMALAFTTEVVQDMEYMKKTWEITPKWREETVRKISKFFPNWVCWGEPWLSWIWIDTGSDEVATLAEQLALKEGMPIRPGSKGYNMNHYIRIGVRSPEEQDLLIAAWKPINEKKQL